MGDPELEFSCGRTLTLIRTVKKIGPDYNFVRSLASVAQTTVHHDRGEG